jgi:hypothetical protein
LANALLREPLRSTAADELYALLATDSLSDRASSPSALSPARAADCTKDLRRTAVFLRGLHDAIRSFDTTVEVLYAGTGPLAPLALPLMALLDNVRFTLVDIHTESTEHLRSLIACFGFEPLVREIVTADATRYEPTVAPHVAITETMRRSLEAEPQVAVTRQLARVLRPEGILLPERITLALEVADRNATMRWLDGGPLPQRQHVATLLQLTRESDTFPPVTVTLPEGVAMLTTSIDVYRKHRLHNLDSGLTTPEVLWNVHADETITFRYEEGPSPRMRALS